MNRPTKLFLLALLLPPSVALAQSNFQANLAGSNEVPAISTSGVGAFSARVDKDETAIAFELSFGNLSSAVAVAHIHFGQHDVNGGVSAFLCGGGGQPACPAATEGQVSGVITAANVTGPAAQGISPGEFAELVHAIRSGDAYVNVHTATFGSGEIRGQIVPGS